MKTLMILILSLLLCNDMIAQKDFEKAVINISPASELVIAGSTNVNKFDCRFDTELISAPRTVEFTETRDRVYFRKLALHLKTQGFDCGHKRMNEDLWDLLKAEKYPEIIINIDRIQLISASYAKAYISVQMAGKTNSYNLPVQVAGECYSGKFSMNIRDFGLEPPVKALGLIEVNEIIEVSFNLNTSISDL